MDSSQNVLASDIYDSFGAGASSGTPTDPFGYGAQWGYYTDRSTGLILCTNRYYNPSQGQWISRDPISYAGGSNLYSYVGNDPVDQIDPSGLDSLLDGDGTNAPIPGSWGQEWGLDANQGLNDLECQPAWQPGSPQLQSLGQMAMVATMFVPGLGEVEGGVAVADGAVEAADEGAEGAEAVQQFMSDWKMGREVHTAFQDAMKGKGMDAPNWNAPGADFTDPTWQPGDQSPQFGELKPYNPGGIRGGLNQLNGRYSQGMTGPGALYVYGPNGGWTWYATVLPPGYFGR